MRGTEKHRQPLLLVLRPLNIPRKRAKTTIRGTEPFAMGENTRDLFDQTHLEILATSIMMFA